MKYDGNVGTTKEHANLSEFAVELTKLINKYSLENRSDTPDWILAKYMIGCLQAFEQVRAELNIQQFGEAGAE